MTNKKEFYFKLSEDLVFEESKEKPEENYLIVKAFDRKLTYHYLKFMVQDDFNQLEKVFDLTVDDTNCKMKKDQIQTHDILIMMSEVNKQCQLSVEDKKAFL